MTNKIIVMLRRSNGDSIECSIKVKDRLFTSKEQDSLIKKLSSKFTAYLDEALYFTVRIDINKHKDNYKVKTIKELTDLLSELFKKYEV